MNNQIILKVLVGSRAHGLSTESSDYDYRSVYVVPTSDILRVDSGKIKGTQWIEGEKEDDTSYEIGHFLKLAIHSNPSILEVFSAPIIESTPLGLELRELFPYVWSSKGVLDAFVGYSKNQQKKMLDDRVTEERKRKFSVAYIRVLIQAYSFLTTGVLNVEVDKYWIGYLENVRAGYYTSGQILDKAAFLSDLVKDSYLKNSDKQTDIDKVNEFLLKVRKENF